MPNYIVNRNPQPNGDYEVHNLSIGTTCLPLQINRESRGIHADCTAAVRATRAQGYSQANGCYYCARSCHTASVLPWVAAYWRPPTTPRYRSTASNFSAAAVIIASRTPSTSSALSV